MEKEFNIAEEHALMVANLAKAPQVIKQELNVTDVHMIHMALGIAGEIGEVIEAVEEDNNDEEIIKELGDLEFYLCGLRMAVGVVWNKPFQYDYDADRSVLSHLSTQGLDLVDLVKKACINRNVEAMQKIISQLERVEIFLELTRQELGFSREQVLQANYDKLSKRYEGFNYSDEAAAAQADKQS